MASVQNIHSYPALSTANPKRNGANGTPMVNMSVHTPMYRARSLAKNISCTVPLPSAAAGEMKSAPSARHAASSPYVVLRALPTLLAMLPSRHST